MTEHRHSPRRNCNIPAFVHCGNSRLGPFTIRNVSRNGLLIETPGHELPAGELVRLAIVGENGRAQAGELEVLVVHSHPDSAGLWLAEESATSRALMQRLAGEGA